MLWSIIALIWLPSTPMDAFFLTEREKHHMVNRLAANKTGIVNNVWKWAQVWEAVMDPKTWHDRIIIVARIEAQLSGGELPCLSSHSPCIAVISFLNPRKARSLYLTEATLYRYFSARFAKEASWPAQARSAWNRGTDENDNGTTNSQYGFSVVELLRLGHKQLTKKSKR